MKQPNAWGIYDMLGNVTEWCLDWRGPYPTENVVDPIGALSGVERVTRGGAWNRIARLCRSAGRNLDAPGVRDISTGFRVVLAPIEQLDNSQP